MRRRRTQSWTRCWRIAGEQNHGRRYASLREIKPVGSVGRTIKHGEVVEECGDVSAVVFHELASFVLRNCANVLAGRFVLRLTIRRKREAQKETEMEVQGISEWSGEGDGGGGCLCVGGTSACVWVSPILWPGP